MSIKLTHLTLIYGVAGAREKFEDLSSHLIRSEFPDLKKLRIVVGDGGIDAYDGELTDSDGISVFQIKYFTDGLGDSQKDQIRKSFKAIVENPNVAVTQWTLCLPIDLSADETKWFETWKAKQDDSGIEICPIWGAFKLECLLQETRNSGIKEDFFKEEHLAQIREIHGTLTKLVQDFDERVPKPEPLALMPHLKKVRSRRSYDFDEDFVIVEVEFCFEVENVSSKSVSNWGVPCALEMRDGYCVTSKTFPKLGMGPSYIRYNSTILPTLSMTTEILFGLKVNRSENFDDQIKELLEPAVLTYRAISDNHVGEDHVTDLREVIDFPSLCQGMRDSLKKEKITLREESTNDPEKAG